jgi:Holliday junction resolvase RusA-like endonuclease
MLLDLIRRVQSLGLPDGSPAAELFEDAAQSLLAAEGPPPQPITGISSEVRTAIARTPKGKPLFLCHTWQTGMWTCLMMDLAPVVMGRPVFVRSPNGGYGRVVTDYQSQKFQRRLAAACIALHVPPPPGPSALCCRLDTGRIFLAWAPLSDDRPALSGDLDNYAKNIMDGLQRAGVVPNDRTIAQLECSRELLPAPSESLDSHLTDLLLRVQADNPDVTQRELARLAGVSQRTTKRLLAAAKTKQQDQEAARVATPQPDNQPETPPLPQNATSQPPMAQPQPESAPVHESPEIATESLRSQPALPATPLDKRRARQLQLRRLRRAQARRAEAGCG